MELSWTTFVLELINFLVLVWVLKRLFYAPVKRAIAARRVAVEKTLRDAESSKREAHELQSRYEGRLREWELEKERQKEEFRKELSEERAKQLKVTESLVAEEREKILALQQKQDAERRLSEEREAMKQALVFASRVLKDVACQELEAKIVDLIAKQLSSDGTDGLPFAATKSWDHGAAVRVRSAYALTAAQRQTLGALLSNKLGADSPIEFGVDGNLLAGLEITLGSHVVRANLRDELDYFSAMRNHE